MMDGFNLSDPLVCEGIIGDGCGGGRIFMVIESSLFAYDPTTKEKLLLLENIRDAKAISKSACIITIETKTRDIFFDLSALQEVDVRSKNEDDK